MYLAFAVGFLPVLLTIGVQKPVSDDIKALRPYAWLVLLGTLYELIITVWLRINHDLWWRVYSLLDFCTASYFFYVALPKKYSTLVKVVGLSFVAIVIVITAVAGLGLESESYVAVPQALLTFLYVFIWFRDLFNRAAEKVIWQLPSFYFVAGSTIYMAATLFLFILIPIIWKNKIMPWSDAWLLNVVAVLFFRLMLTLGIWKAIRK